MKLYRTKLGAVDPFTLLELLDPTVLPLLEAIAAGRVFEVRPERSGYEPAPPGRKQRTAYDAMIEAAAEGGA
jgi:hypothetical protein